MVVACLMPRLGKKTLYLDLDALDKLQAALQRLPGGGPSLSSYLNEQLPIMAEMMEEMVTNAERGGLRGLADMLLGAASTTDSLVLGIEQDVKTLLQEVPDPEKKLSEYVDSVPPKKPRKPRSKRVVEE